MQTGVATVENSMEFLKKLKIKLPFDPVIPLLGIYPNKSKILIQKIYMHPYVHHSIIYNTQDSEEA